MIAGFMSGMAGNVSAFATVWTYDVYRPLLNRKASDRHYLNMGRWSSLLGVLISIGTAYALFYFSNILEFLQVLDFLLHRAAVRRGDPGHALEAGHAGRRLCGLPHGDPGFDQHVGLRPHVPRRLPAGAEVVLAKDAVVTLEATGDAKPRRRSPA